MTLWNPHEMSQNQNEASMIAGFKLELPVYEEGTSNVFDYPHL